MGRTISIRNSELSLRTLVRFIPSITILGVSCFMSANLGMDAYDYFTMNLIYIAFFTVFSSYALADGHKTIGILSIVIGISIYYGTIILSLILPPLLILQPFVAITLSVLNTIGAAFSLFGAASLGLWLSSTKLDTKQVEVKYGALIVSAGVIFVWIFGVTLTLFDVVFTTLTLPGMELLFSTVLIITSSIFIPRRKFITIFFFALGIFLAIWGLMTLRSATTLDPFLVAYFLRVFGTICFTLFALPLGSSSIYSEDHPENPLYIITALWILVEVSLVLRMFIFSPARVFAIYAIIYFSMKTLKTKRPVLIGIGVLIGFILATGGMVIFSLGLLLGLLALYGGLTLAVIGTSLLLFCGFSFGESLRIRFIEKKRTASGIGFLLVLIGLVSGTAGLFTLPMGSIQIDLGPFSFLYLDILFFVLVGLGSMLIVTKTGRVGAIIGAFGFANAPIVLFSELFETVQVFYYPLMFLMIFFTIQQLRQGPEKLERTLRTKKVIPMEITSETLIKSGLYKEPVVKPAEPVESIEPVQSTDFEPDQPVEDEAPVEEVEPAKPSEPVKTDAVVEEVESEISIKTKQQRIPVGEPLPDEQRMARNWYNRAFGFLEVGDLEAAIKAVETALKWQPDHPQALALKKELLEK